jgi:GTPase
MSKPEDTTSASEDKTTFYIHQTEDTRSGYVSIVGKPNVGKSTLLNALMGLKLSITTRKPQTTRDNILGIQTLDDCQITYIDTPGMHRKTHNIQNRSMNKQAQNALCDANLTLFLIDARYPCTSADLWIVDKIKEDAQCAFLILNKIDQSTHPELKEWLKTESVQSIFDQIIPISAKKRKNLDLLQAAMMQKMPKNPHLNNPDNKTQHSDTFLIKEFIRESILNNVHQEIPYLTHIDIEKIEKKEKITMINAVILAPKASYKKILIGHKGETIKHIGMAARKSIEQWLHQKVHLALWVKIQSKMIHTESSSSDQTDGE